MDKSDMSEVDAEFEFIEFTDADDERLERPALFGDLLKGMQVGILEAQVHALEAQAEYLKKGLRTERRIWALVSLFALLAGLVTAALLF